MRDAENLEKMNGGDGFYSPVDEEEGMDLRRPQHHHGMPPGQPRSPMMSLQYEQAQQQHHMMMIRRQQMQEMEAGRGGAGASRSLNLLLESEKVGQATREELLRQKEQLRATETRLDDINATLKQSELRAEAIRNILSGIRAHMARSRQAHQAHQAAMQAARQAQAAQAAQCPRAVVRMPGQPQTVAMRQQQLRQQQQQQQRMQQQQVFISPRPRLPPPAMRAGPPVLRPRMSRSAMMPPAGGASNNSNKSLPSRK